MTDSRAILLRAAVAFALVPPTELRLVAGTGRIG